MRAVSNTSPICNLAIIGRLGLLKERYGQILIPPAVQRELAALSHLPAKAAIAAALREGWIVVQKPALPLPALASSLDAGEMEAIALAASVRADVLLIDEKKGREVARQLGLVLAGVLGELLYAKIKGSIPSLRNEIYRLRKEAGFFVDARIEQFILAQAGE